MSNWLCQSATASKIVGTGAISWASNPRISASKKIEGDWRNPAAFFVCREGSRPFRASSREGLATLDLRPAGRQGVAFHRNCHLKSKRHFSRDGHLCHRKSKRHFSRDGHAAASPSRRHSTRNDNPATRKSQVISKFWGLSLKKASLRALLSQFWGLSLKFLIFAYAFD